MKKYLKGWTLVRALRLAVAMLIVVQGIQAKEWLFVGLGALFAMAPLMNRGCGTSSCSVPIVQTKRAEK